MGQVSQGTGRLAGRGVRGESAAVLPPSSSDQGPVTAEPPTSSPAPEPEPPRQRGRRSARPQDLLKLGREKTSRERKRSRHLSSVEQVRENLLGGPRNLTIHDLAERAVTSVEMARKFWRGMGFPNVQPDAAVFTEADVESLRGWSAMVERGVIDEQTMLSLLRALSYTVDQLAMWQVEAAVDFQQRRWDLDDIAARIVVLNGLPNVADFCI